MRIRNTLWALPGCACLVWVLSASVAGAQVVPVAACDLPDSEFNHLECYKVVEDPKPTQSFTLVSNDLDFLPENTLEKSCRLRVKADSVCIDSRTRTMSPPALGDGPKECANGDPCTKDEDCSVGFCSTAARTTVYGPIPNAWDYVCYKIKCDRQSQPGTGITAMVEDRFGSHTVRVRRSWKMCVPILDKQRNP